MFTGLIEDLGRVVNIKIGGEGGVLEVETELEDINLGDSISVNGACLTVVDIEGNRIAFEVSPETFKRTNLRFLKRGDYVNLERSLKASSRLGGHIVLGHVDFTGKIVTFEKSGEHRTLVIEIPPEYMKYFVEKGSVAVDGISLTVNYIRENRIFINIVPYTFEHTNLKFRKEGDYVNIETDIIGKYVVNYLSRFSNVSLEEKLKSLFYKDEALGPL